MKNPYKVNEASLWYNVCKYQEKNFFIKKKAEKKALPKYSKIKEKLPAPYWEGHETVIACYYKAWEIAFRNLRHPIQKNGFISNYIDTAFNDCLFMWDSSFITMFGKYGNHIFNFQKTLDNFYSHQHLDGFICREIKERQNGEVWHRDDPSSTGPNVMPWSEWEYYQTTGDLERLSQVFYPLLAYHYWLSRNRTWRDGSYWSTGFACGMDNQLRTPDGYDPQLAHGHMIWVDVNAQMLISAKILLQMADILHAEDDLTWLRDEVTSLTALINEKLWNEDDGFYYDLWKNDRQSRIKTVGAYWNLLADVVPADRLEKFVAHLENEAEFNRPHRVPSFPADSPDYSEDGKYWLGAVWAPTNYMVLSGLRKNGYEKLAFDIALNHVANVTGVFENTGTLWENYSSEHIKPGNPAKSDFVGWTGLSPIAVLLEYVFGLAPDSRRKTIFWHINLREKFGIKQYPFLGGLADIAFGGIKDGKPEYTVKSSVDFTLKIICGDYTETVEIKKQL